MPFDGGMLDKKTVLPIIPKSDPWKQYAFSNIRTVPIDEGSVAFCYEVQASHGNDQFHAYVESTYVLRDGKTWRLLVHQQASI